jgi:hypothetical protein
VCIHKYESVAENVAHFDVFRRTASVGKMYEMYAVYTRANSLFSQTKAPHLTNAGSEP